VQSSDRGSGNGRPEGVASAGPVAPGRSLQVFKLCTSMFRVVPSYPRAMKSVLLAVAAGLCWGVGEAFTRSVLHTGRIGPVTAIAVRTSVALPALWIAYLIVVQWQGAEPRDWMRAGWPTLLKLVLGSGLVAGA